MIQTDSGKEQQNWVVFFSQTCRSILESKNKSQNISKLSVALRKLNQTNKFGIDTFPHVYDPVQTELIASSN